MVLQPEDAGHLLPLVAPDPFKNARTVVHDVAKHVTLGLAPVEELPVLPDFSLSKAHAYSPFRNEGLRVKDEAERVKRVIGLDLGALFPDKELISAGTSQ
jgi:hypothetical protein